MTDAIEPSGSWPASGVLQAGDPNQRIYLSGHLPTPREKRFTYLKVAKLLLDNGWPRDSEVLTDALAVVAAESARDPKAYLAYIDLGVDRGSVRGAELREQIDDLPRSLTLTTFRAEVKAIGCKVVRSDCGLFQIGKSATLDRGTVTELMTASYNVKVAFDLWKSSGFQPWASFTTPRPGYTEPPYRWYLEAASAAVETALG